MEHFFICPYCWERISMILESDEEGGRTSYIEDCEVCCRPIELNFELDGEWVIRFDARKMEEI